MMLPWVGDWLVAATFFVFLDLFAILACFGVSTWSFVFFFTSTVAILYMPHMNLSI